MNFSIATSRLQFDFFEITTSISYIKLDNFIVFMVLILLVIGFELKHFIVIMLKQ